MNKSLKQLISIPKYLPSFVPTGFLEIGTFDGADAISVKDHYGVPAYAVEANAVHFKNRMLPLVDKLAVYSFLASDINGEHEFYSISSGYLDVQGMSSALCHKHIYQTNSRITVSAKRIDTFLEEEKIAVNFTKLDVEGYAYQVLVGFGERIYDFEAIQIETEEQAFWTGQKLHSEVDDYLTSKGFKLVEKLTIRLQNDCLYIRQ